MREIGKKMTLKLKFNVTFLFYQNPQSPRVYIKGILIGFKILNKIY